MTKRKAIPVEDGTKRIKMGNGDSFYVPDVVKPDLASAFYETLLRDYTFHNDLKYKNRKGEEETLPRESAFVGVPLFVEVGPGRYAWAWPRYGFGNKRNFTDEEKEEVKKTRRAVEECGVDLRRLLVAAGKRLGIDLEEHNHIVMNHYRDGTDHIGPHRDKTRDLDTSTSIISITLMRDSDGPFRCFELRKPSKSGVKRQPKRVTLRQGSAVSIGMSTNGVRGYTEYTRSSEWNHLVLATAEHVGPRIAITARKVATHTVTVDDIDYVFGPGSCAGNNNEFPTIQALQEHLAEKGSRK